MQESRKINVSGKMKSLNTGEVFALNKEVYILSSVRVRASIIKQDLGMEFTVSVKESEIIVERVK